MDSQEPDKVTKIVIQDTSIHTSESVPVTQNLENPPLATPHSSVTKIPLDNIIKK